MLRKGNGENGCGRGLSCPRPHHVATWAAVSWRNRYHLAAMTDSSRWGLLLRGRILRSPLPLAGEVAVAKRRREGANGATHQLSPSPSLPRKRGRAASVVRSRTNGAAATGGVA